jgi:hypothetical protein
MLYQARYLPMGDRVEAPPPSQRVTPAIEWDEFVAGTARA